MRTYDKAMFKGYPDVVTVADVCKMLKLGRSTVYGLLQSGEIRAVRVGRKYIIPKRSVAAFLASPWYNQGGIIESRLQTVKTGGE